MDPHSYGHMLELFGDAPRRSLVLSQNSTQRALRESGTNSRTPHKVMYPYKPQYLCGDLRF